MVTQDTGEYFSMKPCSGGMLCQEECVPFSDWCSPGTERRWKCGALLQSYSICRFEYFIYQQLKFILYLFEIAFLKMLLEGKN